MSKQEDFGRPKKPLEKTREIYNEARISKKAKMKRKFNRNQKGITLWDVPAKLFNILDNTKQWPEILILKITMLLEFQNKINIKIIGFYLTYFGFALDASDIDLSDLDLLDIGVYSKFLLVSKTYWKRPQDKSSKCLQEAFKTCLQNVFEDEKLLR